MAELVKSKKWYKSKTIWFNVFLAVVGIVMEITGKMENGQTLSFIAVINIILRVVTKTAVTWK